MREEMGDLCCLTFSRKQTSPKTTSAQISNLSSWRTKCSNWCDSLTCWEEKEYLYWIHLIHQEEKMCWSIFHSFALFLLLMCDNIHILPSACVNFHPVYGFQRPYGAIAVLISQPVLGSAGLLLETLQHNLIWYHIKSK